MEKEHLIFSFKIQWVILSGQDSAILSTQVANHNTGFVSSFLLTELTYNNSGVDGKEDTSYKI